jgi:hypothetical protein
MQSSRVKTLLLVSALCLIVLPGCSGGDGAGAAAGVERYLEALVTGDANQLVDASCAAWEADARLELDSFAAVSVELVEMQCEQSGIEGETAVVECSGTIVANYGDEVLEIDLADRTYQAVNESGEWRMCGYR